MAADELSMRLEGGARLDRTLSLMQQRIGTKIVRQSLKKGAADVRKKVKKATPKAKTNTTGFALESRNTTKGQLARSVKSGLRNKVNVPRDVFLAGVWFAEGAGSKPGSDGFYARWVLNRHSPNAFGYRGGNDFLGKAIKSAAPGFRKTVGDQVAIKIASEAQKQIDKLG